MTPGRSLARTRLERAWSGPRWSASVGMLLPFSAGYLAALGLRNWVYARGILRSRRLECPVVSIGNVTVGGTGKTPAAMLAAETLEALGRRPAVVSRGYGRGTRGIQVVADTASIRLEPDDAGDEPFLLARRLPGVPVVVGRSRWAAGRLAVDRFQVDAIVIDDGLQHRTLRKDLEIVMVRGRAPWGNGHLLPAGPLREPLAALARADLVVVTGVTAPEQTDEVARVVDVHAPGTPVLPAAYTATECWEASRMNPVPLESLRGVRVLAFAGIGAPSAFAGTLDETGMATVELVPFADHHRYSARDLVGLARRAAEHRAEGLVTTEKDWARLRGLRLPGVPLWVVGVRLTFLAHESEWHAAFERVCRSA